MARRYGVLVAITCLALVLRTWRLTESPSGFHVDEASFGYNAYSILRTGRDEYGERFPLLFRAFGEYKRPVYVYAAVPSIAVFGLNRTAVRLPAALAGAAAVPLMYVVVALLFRSRVLGLAAAGMLAISPWHLQFSRGTWELSFYLVGVLLMLSGLLGAARSRGGRRAGILLVLAATGAVLALHSHIIALITIPLLGALVVGAFARPLRAVPRQWAAAAAIVLLLGAAPLAQQVLDGRAGARNDQVTLLRDPATQIPAAARRQRDEGEGLPGLLVALQTPPAAAFRAAFDAYLSHFGPSFLFTRGDPDWRYHSSDTAQMFLWDLPLLVGGVAAALRRWRLPAHQVTLGLLLLGPAPAAFTDSTPHASRAFLLLPALYVACARGLPPVWRWLRRSRLRVTWLMLLALSFGYYLFAYHRYYPVERAGAWQDGSLQTFREAQRLADSGAYRRVVIPSELRGVPYIHALFALRYDPAVYLTQGGSVADRGWPHYPGPGPLQFSPFDVRQVDWASEPRQTDVLYLWHGGQDPPAGGRPVAVIRNAAGSPALQLIDFPSAPT